MADPLTTVFSFFGVVYVLVTSLLSGDKIHLDELWEAPKSLMQHNSILPQLESNARVLAGNTGNTTNSEDVFDRAMDSIMSMLNYFDKRIDEEPVIDVFITIHMLVDYCRHLNASLLPKDSQREKLQAIVTLADDVVKRGAAIIQITSPAYYKQLGDGFSMETFVADAAPKMLPNVTYDKSLVQGDSFRGANTDTCFQEIFSCQISDMCWQKMTALPHQSGYMLTHQILYVVFAKVRCSNVAADFLTKNNQLSFEKLSDELCGPTYAQSLDIVQQNYPEISRDLFCEQTFVCGMLGYYQFFTLPIFDAILSWQDPVGCYKYQSLETVSLFMLYNGKRRRKRNEIMKKDMCMPHYTVVCETAIAMFLKFLIEDHNLSFESTA